MSKPYDWIINFGIAFVIEKKDIYSITNFKKWLFNFVYGYENTYAGWKAFWIYFNLTIVGIRIGGEICYSWPETK